MSRDLDCQIAERMGFKVVVHPRLFRTKVIEMDGTYRPIPHYSEDWNDMKLLVEWPQGKGYEVRFTFGGELIVATLDNEEKEIISEWYVDKSAPLALCNAVLSLPAEVLNGA